MVFPGKDVFLPKYSKMVLPVVILEDEILIAESISGLLAEESYQVAGIAADCDEFVRFFEKPPFPVLVICDINLKGGDNGIRIISALKKKYDFEVIFLTGRSDSQTVQQAIDTQPVTYLVKPFSDRQLLVAMQMAFHKILQKQQEESKALDLSTRELEIARLVSQGYSLREIARTLFISAETVRTHRKNMLQRNNLRSFSQLIFFLNQS